MAAEAAVRGIPRSEIRSAAWWVFPAIPLLAATIAFAWTLHGDLVRM